MAIGPASRRLDLPGLRASSSRGTEAGSCRPDQSHALSASGLHFDFAYTENASNGVFELIDSPITLLYDTVCFDEFKAKSKSGRNPVPFVT